MKIAVADTLKSTLDAYVRWVRKAFMDAEVVLLSCTRQNFADLDGCDGLVLTGGGDIHPRFYGREDSLPAAHGVNELRDEFEFALVRQALKHRLPVLGICRGMQVFNVALGGTLIPDVRAAGYQSHQKEKGSTVDPRHPVRLEPDTILQSIARSRDGEVNSSHHQAVDKLGRGLRAAAWSSDGLVEGAEWDRTEGKAFLQLVQWHPERMEDFDNPLSHGLIERFAREVVQSKDLQEK